MWTGAAIVGTVAISQFDEKIARWAQSPGVQGDQSRHDYVDALTHVNETPLTIAAILTYGIGRLGRWPTVTDIGLHATEAMVLTDATSELIRGPLGRARPRISPDDAFKFEFGKGFTDFGYRAFPSLHSAAAFAMAAVVTAGDSREKSRSGVDRWSGPVRRRAHSRPDPHLSRPTLGERHRGGGLRWNAVRHEGRSLRAYASPIETRSFSHGRADGRPTDPAVFS